MLLIRADKLCLTSRPNIIVSRLRKKYMHERASTVVSKIRLSEKPNVLISMASIPSISSFPLPVYVLLKINLCLQSSQSVLFNSISTVAVCDENSDLTCIIWLQRELEHWTSTAAFQWT